MSEFEDPIRYWPDPLTEALVNARPGSRLFEEFVIIPTNSHEY
jgi:hypothetical protein